MSPETNTLETAGGTPTNQLPAKKPRNLKRYIVTLNCVPCGLQPYDRKIIGWRMVPKRGTLVKKPEAPEIFPGKKSAARAIGRAMMLREFWKQAVCEPAPAHRFLVEPGSFAIVLHNPNGPIS